MFRIIIITFLCLLPIMSQAETLNQTLNDIGQRLKSLVVDIQRLSSEADRLSAEAKKAREEKSEALTKSSLDRIQAIETELQTMTAKVESFEFQLNKLTTDSIKRFDDIEFRLCELEEACDISQMSSSTLFEGELKIVIPKVDLKKEEINELAVAEESDYEEAKVAFDNEEFDIALEKFRSFMEAYPEGDLTNQSHYYIGSALYSLEKWQDAINAYSMFINLNSESLLLGESYLQIGKAFAALEQWTDAARSYLSAFQYDREAAVAPKALFHLGISLSKIGQRQEACQTINEVIIRYPDAPIVSTAMKEMQIMECQ